MAHSTPDRIANLGDAQRFTAAAGAFIIELATDRRVQQLHGMWRSMHEEFVRMVHDMLARALQTDAPRIEAWIDGVKDRELAQHERFVRDELKLPEAWVPWVAHELLRLFYLAEQGAQEFSIPLVIRYPTGVGFPQGKHPAHGAQDIKRNIRWFYRAHVQQPPESIKDLARDYQSWAARVTDSRSVVQNGIKQARALLDLAAAAWTVPAADKVGPPS